MERPWLAAAGALLILGVLIDVIWTVLAVASGRGPLTNAIARGIWKTVRGKRRHRTLHIAGVLILLTLPLTWVLGMWAGWALIFNAHDGSVLDASSQAPATVLAKVAYAAGAMAGAGAGYIAATGGWELANNAAALAGLALFTLAISYLVQVVTATTQKRATALHIAGLGAAPADIVAAGAGQSSLGSVGSQITSLTSQVSLIAHQHLALPVVHYLHDPRPSAAIEVSVARLDEALTIIDGALTDDHSSITRPARMAVREYLRTSTVPADSMDPPPPPDLSRLTRQGVSTDTDRFRRHVDEERERRAQLRALVEANGWNWEADVCGR